MAVDKLDKEMLKYISLLNRNQQLKTLDFIKSLVNDTRVSPSQLLSFAGTIPADDLKQMENAVNQDCEYIDEHGW